MKTRVLTLSIVALFLMSCGQRNLDTPAARLVGHWSTKSGDSLYYAKPKVDGLGSYILVQPNGNTARHHYKIISQNPTGERVIVLLLFADGNQRNETDVTTKDGKDLTQTATILGTDTTITLKYVDAKTEP